MVDYYFLLIRDDSAEKLFGLAICAKVTSDLPESLRLLNQIIIRFPNFLPPFTEKVDVLLLSDQWEQALEAASRYVRTNLSDPFSCIEINSQCIMSLTYKVFHSLCRASNYAQVD